MFILSTFKDDFNSLLKSGAFWFALGIAILIIATLVFLFFYNCKKKK